MPRVGSVAVADGAVYAAVNGAGVFAIPCPRAKAEPFDRGAPPRNASFREPYAVDASGDVWVRGQVPTGSVDAGLLDHLMGIVLEAADGPFNELLVLGFLTSMRREWAWRVSRGESLANLEAFRPLLEGVVVDAADEGDEDHRSKDEGPSATG